jgi:type I restriction enzyme S subunit
MVKVCDGEKQNSIQYCDILFTGSSETPNECGMSSVVTEQIKEPIYLNSFSFGFRMYQADRYNPHFLKHLFRSDEIRKQIAKTASGVTRYNVSKVRFAKIEIPVPPLPIQEEIVRILDRFAEYAAELQAELQARKEQYEYYRNRLLSFNPSASGSGIDDVDKTQVVWKTLGEICHSISSGKNNQKSEDGAYPVYGSTGIIARTNSYKYSKQQILVARVGANAGYVHIASEKYDVSDNTIIVDLDSKCNFRFIYYLLINMNLNQYAKGGGQPLITASQIKQLSIPLPPLSEQQRIVSILDRFESLVNDLTAGLPAEIEARRQQYEYYRNQLLTFKRLA